MKFCIHCGSPLNDGDTVCIGCGEIQPVDPPEFVAAQQQVCTDPREAAPGAFYVPNQGNIAKKLHITLFFVWSIILIVCLNPIGTPMGFAACLFAAKANAAPAYEKALINHRIAKILCIIATSIDGIVVLAIIYRIISAFLNTIHWIL